jgi:hypothetical protein
MREFFLETLQNLDKTSGLKQYEKIMAGPTPKLEINALLDVLCRVSDQFSVIPQDAQKRIISQCVVTDGEFIGLNAKIVYKWLAAHRDKYFKEVHHLPDKQDENWKPLEGEARQEKLKEWERSLAGFADKVETKSHVRQLEETLPKKPTGSYVPSAPPEVIEMSKHRTEYARECTDLYTGKKLEGKPDFNTWLEQKLKQ